MHWCGWEYRPNSWRCFEEKEIGIPTVDRFVTLKAERDKVLIDVTSTLRSVLDVVEL